VWTLYAVLAKWGHFPTWLVGRGSVSSRSPSPRSGVILTYTQSLGVRDRELRACDPRSGLTASSWVSIAL
jgi:hypothetical protein